MTDLDQVIEGCRILERYEPTAPVSPTGYEALLVALEGTVSTEDAQRLRALGWMPARWDVQGWEWEG